MASKRVSKSRGAEGRGDLSNGVEIGRRIGWSADGGGFDERGDANDFSVGGGGDLDEGGVDGAGAVAEIGAQGDEGDLRWAQPHR